jgi:type I restriction enzyme S subunit
MSEWQETTLGDLIDIKHGWAFKGEFFKETDHPKNIVVAIGNFNYSGGFRFDSTKTKEYLGSYPQEYDLIPGEILLAMTCQTAGGEILGIPGRIPDDNKLYLHNQRLGKVKIADENITDSSFIYWLCLWCDFNHHLVATATGTKILHTAPERIRSFAFKLPSINEQKQIGKTLDILDRKISNLRQQNETLESIAQTLFKHWFVDFEFPNEDGKPYKSSGGAMVRSDLGDIPMGWCIEPLDKVADFLNGLALQKYPAKSKDDFLPVVKIREMKSGITESTEKASPEIHSKYIIDNGDVLFSWSGSLEIMIWCFGRGALNQHLFKVSSERYPKWFYYFWNLEHLKIFRAIAKSKATTMGHIQRKHLSEALCYVPGRAQLQAISLTMTPILEKTIQNNQQIQTLTQTRDRLLPKLMSGQLQIPE